MAKSVNHSNSIVPSGHLFQKTIDELYHNIFHSGANHVFGDEMIKLLKPLQITIHSEANHELGDEMIKPLKPLHITVHSANHVLGDEMIKLLRPLHIVIHSEANPLLSHGLIELQMPLHMTIHSEGHGLIELQTHLHITLIGVSGFPNLSRREIDIKRTQGQLQCKPNRSGRGVQYDCQDKILNLLNRPLPYEGTKLTELAEELSETLKHIEKHIEKGWGLVTLYKEFLTPERISTMWEIARYNHPATRLLDESHLHMKWKGRSGNINEEVCGPQRKGFPGFRPKRGFPLEGKWEMEIHRTDNTHKYRVVFRGKSRCVSVKKKSEKSVLVFVEENPNGVPHTAKPFDLAVLFGDEGPWRNRKFIVYIRCAGPNVGRAWKVGERSENFWGDLVLVKSCIQK